MAKGGKKRSTATTAERANKRAKAAQGRVNKFEKREARSKHNVYGVQPKGRSLDVGKARKQAMERRKQSLLVEFKGRDKANSFKDFRFGEQGGDGLTAEDRKLEKMKRERLRRMSKTGGGKANKWSIEDNDVLTHMGASLSDVRHATDQWGRPLEQLEGEGDMDAQDVAANFGGGRGLEGEKGPDRRTKREKMHELIQKSKFFKAERQAQHSEQINLVHNLDDDFKGIKDLLEYKESNADDGEPGDEAHAKMDAEMDDFNLQAKKLGMEMKARAADRLKSPEEVAKEARAKLEALEARRTARMMGETVDDEEDEQQGGYAARRRRRAKEDAKAQRALERANNPAFQLDYEEGEEGGDQVGGNLEIDPAFATAMDGEESEDYDDDDDEGVDAAGKVKASSLSAHAQAVAAERELPYVFDAPRTYRDFKALLSGRNAQEQALIIERIRTCNHLSLGAGNRQKMEQFYAILLAHFRSICKRVTKAHANVKEGDDASSSKECKGWKQQLDALARPLFEMSEMMPKFAGKFTRQELAAMRESLLSKVSGDVEDGKASRLPEAHQLLRLHLISKIFPTSDFRHNVITPSLLFMSECMARVPLQGGRDVATALFVCNLTLHFVVRSKRLVPEMMAFLHGLLRAAGLPWAADQPKVGASKKEKVLAAKMAQETRPINFAKGSAIWKGLFKPLKQKQVNSKTKDAAAAAKQKSSPKFGASKGKEATLALRDLFRRNDDPYFSSREFKLGALAVALRLVRQTANLYTLVPSFAELFGPVRPLVGELSEILQSQKKGQVPASLVKSAVDLHDFFETKFGFIAKSRQPLSERIAPTAIKTYNPLYVGEKFNPMRGTDPIKEREMLKRMRQRVKRETKGALRELRRDTQFIAREKARQTALADQDRASKVKGIMRSLEMQQRDTNQMGRAGKKDKERERKSKGTRHNDRQAE